MDTQLVDDDIEPPTTHLNNGPNPYENQDPYYGNETEPATTYINNGMNGGGFQGNSGNGGYPPYGGNNGYPGGGGHNHFQQPKKKKKTWIIWAVVAALVIAGVAGGAWFFLSRSSGGEQTADNKGDDPSLELDTSGYIKAEQSFVSFSDFYNGYALVTYYRSEGDASSLTASLINQKGQLCPIKDGNRTINGIEIGKTVQIYPVQKSGLLIMSETQRIDPLTGKNETRMLAVDKDRNMVTLNEKGYTINDFLGTGEECILMKKATTDKTGVASFNVLGLDGELIKSFDVKGELQNVGWKVETDCAINGKYFILKSNSGNKYLITKEEARLFNPKEESFAAATAEDEMIGLLDCSAIQDGKYKTIILTNGGEIKEVIGSTDYTNAGAVHDGYFFNPSKGEMFTESTIVNLKDGKLNNIPLNFSATHDYEMTSDKPILCGFSGDSVFVSVHSKSSPKEGSARWCTYEFSLNGKQLGSAISGYLTHSMNTAQYQVYYLKDSANYGIRFYEEDEPVVIQSGDTVSFYDENGSAAFQTKDYQLVYQFNNHAARAVLPDLKNDGEKFTSNKVIDYTNADSLFTFKQDSIIYLDSKGNRLFKSVTFPSNY